MSSRLENIFFRRSNLLRWIMSLLLLPAATAYAQDAWQIDPNHSISTLALGSGADTLQIGLARVGGQVVFEASDPADPAVTFKINSNEPGTEFASMSFSSRRCTKTANGKLIVLGDLTVTRVERSVTMDPSEAYAGPHYGDPVTHTDTRPITLVFSDPRRLAPESGLMRFSGISTMVREDFPQLLDAIMTDVWPNQLINDERCTSPSTIGEDYHGVECTGTVIASVQNAVVATGASSGEGFYGFEPVVTPDREKAMIALDLELRQVSASRIASR